MVNKKVQGGIAAIVGVVVIVLFFGLGSLGITEAALPLVEERGQLVAQDEMVGTGEEARAGDTVFVHYTGRFGDGRVFETSVGGEPIDFMLGVGQVIPGWDQGIQGMKVGGKRLLIIPPHLAYGNQDYGPIPANSTLIFEVQLVRVER